MSTAMLDAFYDLAGRVASAQTVASYALQALPSGLKGMEYVRMNTAGNLISALEDILKLMAADVDAIETQMKA